MVQNAMAFAFTIFLVLMYHTIARYRFVLPNLRFSQI